MTTGKFQADLDAFIDMGITHPMLEQLDRTMALQMLDLAIAHRSSPDFVWTDWRVKDQPHPLQSYTNDLLGLLWGYECHDGTLSKDETVLGLRITRDRISRELQASRPPEVILAEIKGHIRDYYYALDTREHGGVAQSKAFEAIQQAMGMVWNQGVEKKSREVQQESTQ